MRTISFVRHLEFEYQGNLFMKAVTVGDVDNDQGNELVLGNVHGDMYIFKGMDNKPWATSSDLGTVENNHYQLTAFCHFRMLTCLEIGDVCNQGMNCIVTLSVEGWCHVFVVRPENVNQDHNCDVTDESGGGTLKPTHRQLLSANAKCVVIADIDDDGQNELVIGFSDRRVKCYKWKKTGDTLPPRPGTLPGKFELLEHWQLAGQIGSMTANKRDGKIELMVSQPGGTIVTLLVRNSKVTQQGENGETTEVFVKEPSLVYHPLGSARARNPGVTTEVVGSISRSKRGQETEVPYYSAICTLDGTLTLVDGDKILWSLYVDHQLFSLTKLDITGDGTEEVIACSWDGQTYLVNLHKEVVRFQFRENVAAFCAGYYTLEKSKHVPCLIYCTFNNKILIYYCIDLPEIGNSNLLQTMEGRDGVEELLNYLNCDPSKPNQVRQLYRWCLYGFHPKNS